MLNRLFELIFCGSEGPCGKVSCSRWATSVQGDDGDLWKDLSLLNHVPEPRQPSVPKIVHFAEFHCDEVSTLYEGSLQNHRNERYLNPSDDTAPDDLELRVESSNGNDDEESNDTEIERRFFSELYSIPSSRKFRSDCSHADGDGSSYSTQRQFLQSWWTASTESTIPTKNNAVHKLTRTQAMV